MRAWSFALLLLCTSAVRAEGLDILAEHHAWGRFKPGASATLRHTDFTTSADGSEQTTKVAVVVSQLEEVHEDGITLKVQETIDGQTAEPRTVRQAWDGQPPELERRLRLSVGEIKVGGATVVCQTHELTSAANGIKTVDKWWYSPDQPPYLLKRILRNTSGPAHFLSVETTSLGVEQEVLGRPLACDEMLTIETFTDRASRTQSVTSLAVPGGLVSSHTQLRDKQKGTVAGKRVELLEYQAKP